MVQSFKYYHEIQHQFLDMSLLDKKQGDVTGDGGIDTVYLYAKKEKDNDLFAKELCLLIKNEWTHQVAVIKLEEAAGYNGRLFLGDFTGDQVLDIFVGMETGGSGGYGMFYVYSFKDATPQKLFDTNHYEQEDFEATYQDFYQMKVESKARQLMFTIDLRSKGRDYLSEFYDETGKLKQPTQGAVLPIGLVQPMWEKQMNLLVMSRIIGTINADTMGYLTNYLVWDGSRFASKQTGFYNFYN